MTNHEALLFISIWFGLFLVLGQSVAIVLMGAGIIGIVALVGVKVLGGLLAPDIIGAASSFSLSIIPLYLVMAQFLLRGRVVEDLFLVGYRLSGRRRFPLGAATIVSGGLLGAVSGSGAAASAALASMASPQLQRVGYTRSFSIALAAISGSLAAIIPPSIIMIIYGSLTLVPVGHLFIGALLPGVLCIAVYIGCLHFFAEVSEEGTDTDEGIETDVSRSAVSAFVFVLILMTVIFGGIYGGIVTAAEAGALGAVTALIGMLGMRRIGLRDVFEALTDSVKVTAMLMFIVLGAQAFGRFLSLSRAPRELLDFAAPMLENPTVLIALLLLVFFVAGLILESAAVMVLIIPIIMPLLNAAEVDLIWFGVMACFMISLGLLTPPVGLATYAACAAAGHPVAPIFRRTGLFALVTAVIVSFILVRFPEVVTWLPSRIQ
ncbi:TRAP transporter, DctM subunit [Salinihabitans flavidus]|uniref:TRAP transporter, DctM subunit n=1 Tax=Salinihabitans flavidus TaxID=569882 RepID=A0A1H8UP38_9RHOB|nr:TRAP transporter large permease subunit [Salinihabitans flavidus]SEP04911.1 TRAP transporter, DctM subunit [Salinihabitans flavidus]